MSSLRRRIETLEAAIGLADEKPLPDQPRVAGKPREVALLEHIDWYGALANHPKTSPEDRARLHVNIARTQQALCGRSRVEILEGYVEYLNKQLADSPDSEYYTKTLAETRTKLAALGSPPRASRKAAGDH
jgi:hypothetical protein